MTRLRKVVESIGALRGLGVAEATLRVANIEDDLEWLAAADNVDDSAAAGQLLRALRALRPRAAAASRDELLAAIRQALDEGPRRQGRPALTESSSRTSVWMTDPQWAPVDQVAREEGVTDTAGEPVRAAAIRLLVDEALAARAATHATPELTIKGTTTEILAIRRMVSDAATRLTNLHARLDGYVPIDLAVAGGMRELVDILNEAETDLRAIAQRFDPTD